MGAGGTAKRCRKKIAADVSANDCSAAKRLRSLVTSAMDVFLTTTGKQ